MDLSTVRAEMLPELFEQVKATPREMLAFQSADGIRFEAALHRHKNNSCTLEIYVRAEQFDDDICERETGEDWVRKALEGSGLEFVEEAPSTYGNNHWVFARVNSTKYYYANWGAEAEFWAAALAALQRAQATHACKCGKMMTTNDACPVCWAAEAAATTNDSCPVCPDAPMKPRRRSQRS
jgi:hypothetical protein